MRRLRQGQSVVGKKRNSFPGSAGGIWAFCKTVAQRKEELFFFYTICSCSAQELVWMGYEVRRRHWSKPSRCAAEAFNHMRALTHRCILLFTLCSHNPTTLNVAAAQIGHLELGHCILILLSNFQSVKRRFYDYDRMREHHQRKIRRLSVMLLSPALVSSIVHLISKEPEYNNANLLSTLLHWRLLILIILMSLLI